MALQPSYSAVPTGDPISRPVSRDSMHSRRSSARRRKSGSGTIARGQASMFSSVVNLLNTIVGAGVLAMPLAMSHMGVTLGVFVIVFSGMASGFGLYLQGRCSRYVERGSASFFSLSQLTYPSAGIVFDTAVAIKCFGVGISYLIIIGDLMPQVAASIIGNHVEYDFIADRHFWITFFMLFVIPISFLKRLDSLKYTSFVALVSIGYLVLIVVGHFFKGDTIPYRGNVNYFKWAGPVETLSSWPIIVFAYTCHQNMFSVLNEIKDNSHQSIIRTIAVSIGTAVSIYLLVAITGYISFGDTITGNIISMYRGAVSATIGRAAIVILVMFSYPLQLHPCRASIGHIIKWRPSSASRPTSPTLHRTEAQMSDLRFAIITTVLIIASYFVAITVTSLERVLAYVGSTGSTSISFILPGLFYWRISRPGSLAHKVIHHSDDSEESDDEEGGQHEERWQKKYLRYAALGLMIYGILVMVTCLTMNIFYHVNMH